MILLAVLRFALFRYFFFGFVFGSCLSSLQAEAARSTGLKVNSWGWEFYRELVSYKTLCDFQSFFYATRRDATSDERLLPKNVFRPYRKVTSYSVRT